MHIFHRLHVHISLHKAPFLLGSLKKNETSHPFTKLLENPQSTVRKISEIIEDPRSGSIPLRSSRVRTRSFKAGSSKLITTRVVLALK